jgi:hypothetical protein
MAVIENSLVNSSYMEKLKQNDEVNIEESK